MNNRMTSSFRRYRSVLVAVLALAALPMAPALAQEEYAQTVFFGDSLTDSGFYQTFLVENVDPSAAVAARFTTNPGLVWAEFLADFYGTDASAAWQLTSTGIATTGGHNYAAGGATINSDPGFPPAPPTQFAPSLATQIGAYLASNGGQADPNTLYTVWGGANDLFFLLNGATTQEQFLGAAGAEVGLVQTLTSAGAQYILVPTLPDVGATPFGLSQGVAGAAAITALSSAYNQTLFGSLAAAGLRVIPLDTFSLLREINADPGLYGFTNVTSPACGTAAALGCNPANFVTPNAPWTYAFADGVHPTTAGHEILAQYAISILEAPRRVAILPHSVAMVGRARADMVAVQMSQSSGGDGSHWWASARSDDQRFGPGGSADLYDGGGPSLTVGVDWAQGQLVYGVFGGYGRQSIDWGLRQGDFEQRDASLGGYLGWQTGNLWVNGQLSYTQLNFDINRDIQLGAATRQYSSTTDGNNFNASVNAGWNLGGETFRHGPVLGVLAQRIDINGFSEDRPTESTSLAYPDQNFDSLIGTAGWQATYTINEWFIPYAKITYDHEFEHSAEQASASVQSIPGSLAYAVPGVDFDRSYGTLTYGTRGKLGGFEILTGSAFTFGQTGGNHASFFINARRPF